MKVKNVKMVEQHVEKMVFGVAAAAAVYLAYSAFTSPVTVDHNGSPVKANEITTEVNRSVEKLRTDVAKNAEQQQPVEIENYVEKYKAIANQPLPEDLQHGIAAFTPLHMGPPAGGSTGNVSVTQISTPIIPPPAELTAQVARGRVALGPPPAPDAPATPPGETKDLEWVMIKANYPMLKLAQAMSSAQNHIPAEAQRITFFRLEVERQKQNADGSWSNTWERIPVAKSVEMPPGDLPTNADPEVVKKTLDDLDAAWPTILRPAFYREVTPALQVAVRAAPPKPTFRPPPSPVGGDVAPPLDADAGTGPSSPLPPVLPLPRPKPTSVVTPKPAAVTPPTASGGADAPSGLPSAESLPPEQGRQVLLQEENSPIWFYDEHVQGGERYRYRMRVAVYNPLFQLTMPLRDPNASKQPWLRSEWAVLSEPVTVTSSRQMFVVRSMTSAPNMASFRLYRWQYGHWFGIDENFGPGQVVGKPRKPSNFSEIVDYETGYTVVSVDTEKSGETRVVLQAPDGELIVRDSLVDHSDPERARLDAQINKEANATQPAPAAAQ